MLDRLAFRHERRIAREIARVMREGAKAYSNGISPDFTGLDHPTRMKSIMRTLYRETVEAFSKYFLKSEKGRVRVLELKDSGFSVDPTVITDEVMANWVAQYGGDRITQITNTTKRDINRIIQAGIKDGLSEREIGKMISAVAPVKSASRAQTIARTETHSAANATGIETAQGVGLEMKKIWVAAGGGRTRDSHRRADSDYKDGIGLDDYFIVGGERLRYPADPSGSAKEVINCRCALVYEIL